MNYIVLSSSNGTILQAVIDACNEGILDTRPCYLLSDNEDRGCVAKARAAGIPVMIVERNQHESLDEYDVKLSLSALKINKIMNFTSPPFIALLGWNFILRHSFLSSFPQHVLNVHPSLLPKYGGRGMYGMRVHEAVIASGDKQSGMTIHQVDENVDTGHILLQKSCDITAGETALSLQKKVQNLEKIWFPKVLQMISEGSLVLHSS